MISSPRPAALTFYWPQHARQVRIRGRVEAAPAEASAADFLARPVGSRAEATLGRQSQPLDSWEALDLATKLALERIDAEPDLVIPEWTLYTLNATNVEFWQGDKQRKHRRLQYRRTDTVWTRHLAWP